MDKVTNRLIVYIDNNDSLTDNDYTGIILVSFLIPFIGLIIYAANIGSNPKIAKVAGKTVLISFCLYVLVVILFVLLAMA